MDGREREQLEQTLVDAFTREELGQFCLNRLGKRLDALVRLDLKFPLIVHNLVNVAEREGWLPDLVEQVRAADLAERAARRRRQSAPVAFLRAYAEREQTALLADLRFLPQPPGPAAATDLEAQSVPLRVRCPAPRREAPPPGDRKDARPPPDVVTGFDEAFAAWQEQGRALVVVGDPGHGKSWLVGRLTQRMLRQLVEGPDGRPDGTRRLPLRVSCWRLGAHLAADPKLSLAEAVSELAAEPLVRGDPEQGKAFTASARDQIQSGSAFLLLDGWDEADPKHRPSLQTALANWLAQAPGGRLLLTSRGESYADQLPGATVWHLMPMQPAEVEPFFVRWFRDDAQVAGGLIERLRQHPALMRLAEVPLVAALLCWLWQSGEGEWPERAAPLLAACVMRRWRNWPSARSTASAGCSTRPRSRRSSPRRPGASRNACES